MTDDKAMRVEMEVAFFCPECGIFMKEVDGALICSLQDCRLADRRFVVPSLPLIEMSPEAKA